MIHIGIALIGDELARHFVKIVVLPGDIEIVFMAAAARQLRRSGIGTDVENVTAHHLRHHGHGDVGKDDAGDDFDVLALDIAFRDLLAAFGFSAVVLHQQLNLDAAEFAASLLHGQAKSVADLLAEVTGFSGERRNHSNLDRVGRCDAADGPHDRHEYECECFSHDFSSLEITANCTDHRGLRIWVWACSWNTMTASKREKAVGQGRKPGKNQAVQGAGVGNHEVSGA